MAAPITVYSYIRFSTPEQIHGDSIRRQKERSAKWVKQKGYVLDTTLKLWDFGLSAFKGDNAVRGKLGAFIRAVDEGRVKKGSILLVESLDRLSRQQVPDALELFLSILNRGIVIQTLDPESTFERKTLDETQLIIAIVILSRANNESSQKAIRASEVWNQRRKNIHKEKLTARSPSWMELSEDRTKFVLIPENVAIVKRVFKMAETLGVTAIARVLNEEGVPTIGRATDWRTSGLLRLLKNRAVLGEFTPRHGRPGTTEKNRPIVGDTIPDYYPRIIDDATFYRVQSALEARFNQRGPKGKAVSNLFTGLLRDARDGGTMTMVNKRKKGMGKSIVSSAGRYGVKGAKFASFSYDALEDAFLTWTKEIKPQDLLPQTENGDVQDQIDATQGRLKDIQTRLKAYKARLRTDDDFTTLLDVVKDLEQEHRDMEAKLETLRAELHQNRDSLLAETQETIRLLDSANGEDLRNIRLRLQAKITALVEEVWILVQPNKNGRIAFVQVHFRDAGIRRMVIVHKIMYTRQNGTPVPRSEFTHHADTDQFDPQNMGVYGTPTSVFWHIANMEAGIKNAKIPNDLRMMRG